MPATNLNHVSIGVRQMDESVRFYTELFGLEKIPTPNFGFPVQWLRVGDLQLHLFKRDVPSSQYHHFGLTVDDFTTVYRKAKALGVCDGTTFGHHLYELPGGGVQLYLRDPAGNLVEVDWPDVTTLDRLIVADLKRLADVRPQAAENLRATLFLTLKERRQKIKRN
jgi:catechol 2,3-dioxygenase-like lactoylglutathione lyase family enzyme